MNTTEDKSARLQEIGRNAFESIREMVAALECDYERLAELRDEREGLAEDTDALAEWDAENGEELAELESAAGDCTDREDAEQRIREAALSVEVRSGWYEPGDDAGPPEEFRILLATGGPAVRIRGELDEHGQPIRARLQVQDWFTPWTDYVGHTGGTLLAYCYCFYFGE